jgi:flagellar biosynthesis/type III secretory pathway chaperone
MICISGTSLGKEAFEGFRALEGIDVRIENDESKRDVFLKTVARSAKCLHVYLKNPDSYGLADVVRAKTSFFNTDEELLQLVAGGEITTPEIDDSVTIDELTQEEDNVEYFTPTENDTSEDKVEADKESFVENVASDVVSVTPDGELIIDVGSKDINALHTRLEAKEVEIQDIIEISDEAFNMLSIDLEDENIDSRDIKIERLTKIVEQKDSIIQDLKDTMNQTFEIQERELLAVVEENKETITRLTNSAKELQDKYLKVVEQHNAYVDSQALFVPISPYSRLDLYSGHPKAVFVEKYTDEEKASITVDISNIYAFMCGGGDSYSEMLKQVKTMVKKNVPCLIVDLSSDYYLNKSFDLVFERPSIDLKRKDIPISDLVVKPRDYDFMEVIPSSIFHSAALIDVDWINVLQRLASYAGKKPVILLFDSIKNFPVGYTLNKLSQLVNTYVFVVSNPVVLRSAQGNSAFCTSHNITFIVMNYIEVIKPMLDLLSRTRHIFAYAKDVNFANILTNYVDIDQFYSKSK